MFFLSTRNIGKLNINFSVECPFLWVKHSIIFTFAVPDYRPSVMADTPYTSRFTLSHFFPCVWRHESCVTKYKVLLPCLGEVATLLFAFKQKANDGVDGGIILPFTVSRTLPACKYPPGGMPSPASAIVTHACSIRER
jgi:hypothetical protein